MSFGKKIAQCPGRSLMIYDLFVLMVKTGYENNETGLVIVLEIGG